MICVGKTMLTVPTEVLHWTIGCEPGPGKNYGACTLRH
jgi:hypothetical protein